MDMKRTLLSILLVLIIPLTMAQYHPNNRTPKGKPSQHNQHPNRHSQHPNHHSQHQRSCTLHFYAERNEQFYVSVDGRNINRKPRNSVIVNDLSFRSHDVYVVVKHPVNDRVYLKIDPQMEVEKYVVSYNERTRKVMVTPMYESHHHPHQGPQPGEPHHSQHPNSGHPQSPNHGHVPSHSTSPHNHQAHLPTPPTPVVVPAPVPVPVPPVTPPEPLVYLSEEVNDMCQSIRKESFDDNRLEMAKLIVRSRDKMFKTSQIKQMANCFSFEDSKVEFLKFAFDACVDQNNYYECVSILTFSSNKEELMEFINSKLK